MKETFSNLYMKLYKENYNELEILRNKAKNYDKEKTLSKGLLIAAFVIPGLFMASSGIGTVFALITFPILLIIAIVASVSLKKKITQEEEFFQNMDFGEKLMALKNMDAQESYNILYKKQIVAPLIQNLFEQAEYLSESGLPQSEYMRGHYKDKEDRYTSDDLVTGFIDFDDSTKREITFAEVHTERRDKDENGVSYETIFWGIAGIVRMKIPIASPLFIKANGRSKFKKERINMDMREFETLFDVECDDRLLAMRILTSDTMANLLDLLYKYENKFEISIISDKIYIRINCGKMFEPNIYNNSLQLKALEKYYKILKNLIDISKQMCQTIESIEV